jgi:diguanylate cyclase (GGDEF)-like protein/PAS domain S-box-containing protein
VLGYGLLLMLLLASALGFVLWRDHQGKLEAASRQSEAQALGSARLIGFQLRNLDRAMRGIVADVQTLSAAAPDAVGRLEPAFVQGVVERHAELESVVLVDARGRALTPNGDEPELEAWAGIARRQVGDSGLSLGPPRRQADGDWLLPMARPLPVAVGGGWVVARLRLSALQDVIVGMDLGPRGVAALLARDGTVLARSRDAERQVGQRYPELPVLRDGPPPGSHGVGEETSSIDGVARIRAYRALEDYPLILSVGLARKDVLASWWPFVGVAALAGVLYALGWTYLVRSLLRGNAQQRILLDEIGRTAGQLHEAQRIAGLGSWTVELNRQRVEFSPEAKRIHGLPDDGQPVDLETALRLVHPEDLPIVEAWRARFNEGEPVECEYRIIRPDGSQRVLRGRGRQVRDGDHGALRDTGTVLDVSARAKAHEARNAAERQYRFMFDRNPLPFWVYRRDTLQFMAVNDAAVASYGYSRGEFLAMTLLDIRPDEDAEDLKRAVRRREESGRGQLWRHRRKDGSLIDVRIYAADMEFEGHSCRLVLAEDVTERLRVQREIAHRASHDELTGLGNRVAVLEQLAGLVAHARDTRGRVAVLHLDMRQFKLVNDSLGHEVGDEVLKVVAGRLSALGPGRVVGRLGGDEFALLAPLEGADAGAATEALAARVHQVLAEPVEVMETLHYLHPDIGYALHPEDGEDPERLLHKAGVANHEAKRRDRPQTVRYRPDLERRVQDRLQMVARLHEAIERQEFELHFQPQYFASGREPIGLEALVRWRHPERGLVPPGEFIPVCEDSGLIVPLGRWVLREAARHHRLLVEAGWQGLTIAVNVSAIQFRSGELEADVDALVREFALPPGVLELELTESIVMDDPEAAIAVLERLRQFGVLLSIDDFGTGYSSMSYLHRLPVDKLKIDRSFVTDVEEDSHNAAICESVLSLARSFGLKVIAEGVETQAQMDWLRQRGCDEIQGFLLARPMPFEDVLRHLRPPPR